MKTLDLHTCSHGHMMPCSVDSFSALKKRHPASSTEEVLREVGRSLTDGEDAPQKGGNFDGPLARAFNALEAIGDGARRKRR